MKATGRPDFAGRRWYCLLGSILIFTAVSAVFRSALPVAASTLDRATLVVGSGDLQISIDENSDGAEISAITARGTEILNTAGASELFQLKLKNLGNNHELSLDASSGWGPPQSTNDGTNCTIRFAQPAAADAPSSLVVDFSLVVAGGRSHWDLEVSGLGDFCTLEEVRVFQLNLRASVDDTFLLPRYSGILRSDPVGSGLDWHEIYPAGWHASMQFFALFNEQLGLYFGFHDPKSNLKYFDAEASDGGISLSARYPAPDHSLAGNDWQMPGVFELDIYDGDWYEAAGIYRQWVETEADFRPQEEAARQARLEMAGRISLWATFGGGYDPATVENHTLDFASYMGVPSGLTWYEWNGLPMDDSYPEYFPELDGMSETVADLQAADVTVVPYINGRLFDLSLDGSGPSGLDFVVDGDPFAVKNENGDLNPMHFAGNDFAVMCPSQTHWRDILISASTELMGRIGAQGLYLDMIGASSPRECMVSGHGHPLGGGDLWAEEHRRETLEINAANAGGRFLATEGGADYLAGAYDAFMVQGWQADGMVPAFQRVFSGKIMLFGMKTGVSQYPEQQFYSKLSRAWAYGIQLGRFYTSIQDATGAAASAPIFVRKLARFRHKLVEFFSFGEMLRPLSLSGIPQISTTWTYTYDGDIPVTTPAIETSTWSTERLSGTEIAFVFVNASMNETISFDFDCDASDYGLEGPLYLQEIGETANGAVASTPAVFSRSLSLAPMDAVAFIVSTSPEALEDQLFNDGFESGHSWRWRTESPVR